MISSPLMASEYTRLVPDYDAVRSRTGGRRERRLPRAATDPNSSGQREVGAPEIVSDAEERLVGELGDRVGEAVAEVQAGRMVAFAEPPKASTAACQ
jgi:hypothetical protein